jgi:hypothetical protein
VQLCEWLAELCVQVCRQQGMWAAASCVQAGGFCVQVYSVAQSWLAGRGRRVTTHLCCRCRSLFVRAVHCDSHVAGAVCVENVVRTGFQHADNCLAHSPNLTLVGQCSL